MRLDYATIGTIDTNCPDTSNLFQRQKRYGIYRSSAPITASAQRCNFQRLSIVPVIVFQGTAQLTVNTHHPALFKVSQFAAGDGASDSGASAILGAEIVFTVFGGFGKESRHNAVIYNIETSRCQVKANEIETYGSSKLFVSVDTHFECERNRSREAEAERLIEIGYIIRIFYAVHYLGLRSHKTSITRK